MTCRLCPWDSFCSYFTLYGEQNELWASSDSFSGRHSRGCCGRISDLYLDVLSAAERTMWTRSNRVATLIAAAVHASQISVNFFTAVSYHPRSSLPQQTGLRRLRLLMFRISRRIEIKILQPVIVASFE
jgi:hypothetical protein